MTARPRLRGPLHQYAFYASLLALPVLLLVSPTGRAAFAGTVYGLSFVALFGVSALRIIAGAFKGRRLAAPPGLATRPLPDRVKQALFDWLGQRMDGLHVADCCAGSEAFAFEALSRGARRIDAIEPGAHALPVLRANAAKLGNPTALVLHPRPFQTVLPRLHDVDLIFADPPFAWYAGDAALIAELLRLGACALSPAGRLVLRGERGVDLPGIPSELVESERRAYGRSWLALFRRA